MRAVNVDPLNATGRPSPADLRLLGLDGVRLVLRPTVADYVAELRADGLMVLGVLAQESFDGDVNATLGISVDLYQLGNEPDGAGPSSWIQTQDEYLTWWSEWARRLDRPVLLAGLTSGNPDWLSPIAGAIADAHEPHGLAVHPYGKPLAPCQTLLNAYANQYGWPIWATEWNRPAEELGGYCPMLDAQTAGAAWFCWSDGMVEPFGLLLHDGSAKAEVAALTSVWGKLAVG